MIFLVGLLIGVFVGTLAQLAVGSPLLVCKGLGLLWGDRRLWWTAALLLAIVIGFYYVDASQRHKIDLDRHQRGYAGYGKTGIFAGATITWAFGMLILWKLGANWKAPIPGISPVVSCVLLTTMIAGGLILNQRPKIVRQERTENRAKWDEATKAGDIATLRSMVESGARFWDPSDALPGGAVIYSVNHGKADFLTELLSLHPSPDFARQVATVRAAEVSNQAMLGALLDIENPNRPALVSDAVLVAIRLNDTELYRWLFERMQADPNQLPTKGPSPLMSAAGSGKISLVDDLLERGAELEHLGPGNQYLPGNALASAVHYGQSDMVRHLLAIGADPNARNPGSYTPLMRAIDRKHPELIPVLLEAGADPNLADKSGNAALHLVCRGRSPQLDLAKQLMEAGADPEAENNKGFRPSSRLSSEEGE